ncbi:MAG: hypothetical protein QXS89_06625 [Sulfolobales archaeon]
MTSLSRELDRLNLEAFRSLLEEVKRNPKPASKINRWDARVRELGEGSNFRSYARDHNLLISEPSELRRHGKSPNAVEFVISASRDRTGDLDQNIKLLKEYLGGREIVLDVLNPGSDEIEDPRITVAKVERILKHADPRKIYLNPDCGPGIFSKAPSNTPRSAFRKSRPMRVVPKN